MPIYFMLFSFTVTVQWCRPDSEWGDRYKMSKLCRQALMSHYFGSLIFNNCFRFSRLYYLLSTLEPADTGPKQSCENSCHLLVSNLVYMYLFDLQDQG